MHNTIPAETIHVPGTKMFTSPTRLADAFSPSILEIYKPAYDIFLPAIEYNVIERVTETKMKMRFHKEIYSNISPPIKIEDDCVVYDARYSDQGNVAHLLFNMMPICLFIAKNSYPNLTVIFNEKTKSTAEKMCQLMGFNYIKTDRKVFGKIISSTEPYIFNDKPYTPLLKIYDDLYNDLIENHGERQELPEKVFISRRGSRNITNASEIEKFLVDQYGFQKFYFEDIPMLEQWSIIRHAKVVVGIHGAAFGALVFNRNQVKVLEFFNPGYVVNSIKNVTIAVGGKWSGIMGDMPELYKESAFVKNPRIFATSPVTISPESLRMGLEYLKID
jgi:capsular polysaccharide biosynthesis protein